MRIILLHGKVNVLDMLRARASNRNGEHSGLARPRWAAALVTLAKSQVFLCRTACRVF